MSSIAPGNRGDVVCAALTTTVLTYFNSDSKLLQLHNKEASRDAC